MSTVCRGKAISWKGRARLWGVMWGLPPLRRGTDRTVVVLYCTRPSVPVCWWRWPEARPRARAPAYIPRSASPSGHRHSLSPRSKGSIPWYGLSALATVHVGVGSWLCEETARPPGPSAHATERVTISQRASLELQLCRFAASLMAGQVFQSAGWRAGSR